MRTVNGCAKNPRKKKTSGKLYTSNGNVMESGT